MAVHCFLSLPSLSDSYERFNQLYLDSLMGSTLIPSTFTQ